MVNYYSRGSSKASFVEKVKDANKKAERGLHCNLTLIVIF